MQQILPFTSQQRKLYDYQNVIIKATYQHLRNGIPSVLICLATGGGKTVIFTEIVSHAVSRGKRVLILVHRDFLVEQVIGYFHAGTCGRIQADYRADYSLPVQVAMVQTLSNRDLPDADLVIVDECHHVTAETYKKIIDVYASKGAKILGFSATPIRKDGSPLNDLFQEIVVGLSVRELIEKKRLSSYVCFSKNIPDLSQVPMIAGDYNLSKLETAVNITSSNEKIVQDYLEKANRKRAVVFAVSVRHCDSLVSAFLGASIPCVMIEAKTPSEERKKILVDFSAGKILVLVNCMIFTEGFDLPACEVVITARPTKSLGLWLQCLGRGLRYVEGKTALILDHTGCALDSELGLPDDERDWEEWFREPAKPKKKQNPHKTCKVCFAVNPAHVRVCTQCGTVFPVGENPREVEIIDVPLSEVIAGQEKEGLRLLRLVQKKKGYRSRWAKHVWEEYGERIYTEKTYFSWDLGVIMERERILGKKLKPSDIRKEDRERLVY